MISQLVSGGTMYRRRHFASARPLAVPDQRGESDSSAGGVVVLVVGVLVAVGWLFGGADLSDDAPQDQQEFVDIVQVAHESADGNDNEMRIVQVRKSRNGELCESLPKNKAVSGWVGEDTDLDTTLGGDSGVLTIEMAEDIEVATWNNGFSDAFGGADTLIDTDSDLYASLASLEEGAEVVFGGKFVADEDHCLRESSVTDRGGMTTPPFIFRFDSVEPT